MARTRRMTGQYTPHNTPGDGTGLTHFPPQSPYSVLTDATSSSPNSEHTAATREEVICDYPTKVRGKGYRR